MGCVHKYTRKIPNLVCHAAPCNGIVSNVDQIGGLQFLQKRMQNKCVHDLCTPGRVLHTGGTNHGYFDYKKNPETQFEPHADIKMEQALGSPLYICGCVTQ